MQAQTNSSSAKLMKTGDIKLDGLSRIGAKADTIRAKAMELTDTWGGAMFIVDPEDAKKLFCALGFDRDVASEVYRRVYDLRYVDHVHADKESTSEFTWHGPDATTLVLRGFDNVDHAFASVTDETAEALLDANRERFDAIMEAIPEYASKLMFSTRIGCDVLAAFGAKISEDKLFELGLKYGRQRTTDLEGRRGVATQFVRAFTLTMSSTIS